MTKIKLDFKNTAFCTYFDKNYLPKGLAMIDSFHRYDPKAILFVLCFDDFTTNFLIRNKYKNVIPITLKQFEDYALLRAKKNRSIVEYYWTCTPSLPLFLLNSYPHFEAICYLDADLYFFDSVKNVFEEFGDNSIYTVEHRYVKGQEGRIFSSGRFNVAFQIFRRDTQGVKCLNRWRKQCLKWCYWKEDKGKMGDQMYLNEWPDLYSKIRISQNIGIDTAPWNVSQYKIKKINRSVYVNKTPLICYHFHQFQILSNIKFINALSFYFNKDIIDCIYKPYRENIKKQIKIIQTQYPEYIIPKNTIPLGVKIRYSLANIVGPLYWKYLDLKKNGKIN